METKGEIPTGHPVPINLPLRRFHALAILDAVAGVEDAYVYQLAYT